MSILKRVLWSKTDPFPNHPKLTSTHGAFFADGYVVMGVEPQMYSSSQKLHLMPHGCTHGPCTGHHVPRTGSRMVALLLGDALGRSTCPICQRISGHPEQASPKSDLPLNETLGPW